MQKFWAGWMVLVNRRSFDVERTSVGRVWQNFVLSHVEVVGVDRLLPEDKGYEGDGNNQHVQQVEAVPTESVFVEDEAVGDDLEDQLDGEDGGEEVVPVSQSLRRAHYFSCRHVFGTLTILTSDSLLRGSSQASKAEETRMHTRMQLDMMG